MTVPAENLRFREGRAADLEATFALSQHARYEVAMRQGLDAGVRPDEAEIGRRFQARRPLLDFIAGQPDGSFWVCEDDGALIGYARVTRFGSMEELTELAVVPSHQGRGLGRALLERCWPGPPSPQLGRVALASGAPADLTLFTEFGVMPITGHWHLRIRADAYVERRSQETMDVAEPAVVALKSDRAVAEWQRLEPPAIGHERPLLHEFFARSRTCLAVMDGDAAAGLVWVSPDGDIGPGVGASAEDLVPVMLAALDRVAKMHEPEALGVFCTTDSWWLLRHLRRLGFRIHLPSYVMCSVPLPGLDRYVPTRPPNLL